jgi:hypothetical protein
VMAIAFCWEKINNKLLCGGYQEKNVH